MTTTTASSELQGSSELQQAWTDWRRDRETELSAEHGWLSLTGFDWLPTEPSALDGLPGRWYSAGDGAVLGADATDGLVLASGQRTGEPIVGTITASVAEAGSLFWVRHGALIIELVLRGGRYAIRRRDPQGPERLAFQGIPAFEVDPHWIRPGRFSAYDVPRRITVDTARDDLRQQVTAVGTVEVSFDRFTGNSIGSGRHLLIATAGRGGRLNLSFRDTTNRRETARWRVVTTSAPTPEGALVVDFNRTVNLPFAFTEFGTCPAPIPGNELPFAVTAGERAPVRVTP